MNYSILYAILLEIRFNVSSLDGNTGSADYSKKNCVSIYPLSKPLLDIIYLTVYENWPMIYVGKSVCYVYSKIKNTLYKSIFIQVTTKE